MVALTSGASVQPFITHFDRWWNSAGAWVEPVNQRRGGESGVQLLSRSDPSQLPLYCKRQVGHLYRSIRYPFGRPTVLRECDAYRTLARLGIKTPNIVYCATRRKDQQWQSLLVTESLRGFVSLTQWYEESDSPELNQRVLRQIAVTLARMHQGGFQHGCCYPKHIFVKLQPGIASKADIEIALLDLEKSRHRWRAKDASRHDLRQLMRHRGSIPEADVLFVNQIHQQVLQGTME
ncbi:lipopolysaccharide kinase InaA family protein [Pseudomonas sp.]|uniref:lipopolysaccharide kinase InaA family protein n=1 Tax=Pseudomonas sp. TaxID=306 RepID=UPI003BB80F41